MPINRKLHVTSLRDKGGYNLPGYLDRIDAQIRKGKILMILIDGQGQVGKTTFGGYLCNEYDREYVPVYTIEDIVKYLLWAKEEWLKGNQAYVTGKFLLYDEPQIDCARNEYYSKRNIILEKFTSAYGFLKNGLVLCLPTPKGLSDRILINLTLRISLDVWEMRGGGIIRKGFVKLPKWNDIKQKHYWTTVEKFTIPFIKEQKWLPQKMENFFDTQLNKWASDMGVKVDYKKAIEDETHQKNLEFLRRIGAIK
jgi:hypothetical protein